MCIVIFLIHVHTYTIIVLSSHISIQKSWYGEFMANKNPKMPIANEIQNIDEYNIIYSRYIGSHWTNLLNCGCRAMGRRKWEWENGCRIHAQKHTIFSNGRMCFSVSVCVRHTVETSACSRAHSRLRFYSMQSISIALMPFHRIIRNNQN